MVVEIFCLGVGDVVVVLKKVIGIMIVDGKYVYVCGLGDCYLVMILNGLWLFFIDFYCNSV